MKKIFDFPPYLCLGRSLQPFQQLGFSQMFFTPEMRYAMAVLYSSLCGIIPGATWSAAVSLAPSKDLAGAAIGWVVRGQFGNISFAASDCWIGRFICRVACRHHSGFRSIYLRIGIGTCNCLRCPRVIKLTRCSRFL